MKKILMAIFTILISLVIVFGVIQSMPGDPVDIFGTRDCKVRKLTI